MQKHFKSQSRLWDYQIIKKLGKGTSGEVYQVQNKSSKQLFALKKIPLQGTQDRQKLNAFKQIKCLSLLDNPSIIAYHESFLSMDHIYIVMEYANRGDFLKIVEQRKRKQKYFTENELWDLYGQIVNAIKYLHEKNVIHRDIKLENIFMTSQQTVKVGDLGMSKIMLRPDQLISTRVGTPIYFAPEMIQNQMYSFPVDVWSLGCVLYYLAALQHPFHQATIETLAYHAIDRPLKPINGRYSVQMINFIHSCFEKQPNKRPNIFELALKIKAINQSNNSKPRHNNKISIFNIKHLNKIFNTKQNNFDNYQNNIKIQTKSKTQRDFSLHLQSPRKIYTSMTGRINQLKEKTSTQNLHKRNIRTSCQNRTIKNNFFNPQFPKSPRQKKRLQNQQKQTNYRTKKLIESEMQTNFYLPLKIKTNGFSMEMVSKTQRQKNMNCYEFNQFDNFAAFPEKVPLFNKIRGQKSSR